MNAPLKGLAVQAPSYVKNAKLIAWVADMAALCKPDSHPLVRRQPGRIRPPVPAAGRRRHLQEAEPGQAPQLLPGPLRSERRRARRRPHLHLLRQEGRRRPHQQLDGAGRDARHAAAPVRRLHEGPHDVRRALQHGPARLADRAHRRRAVRQPLRGRQHADHDPHGQGRVRRAGRRWRVRALRAHRRRAAASPARRTWPGPATRPSTSSTSPRRARSGATAPATAATRCWARSASRCASPRPWAATKAGWPSTC